MRMTTLYAALSGAFLLGTAALAPAQTSTATPSTPPSATSPAAPAGSSITNPIKNAKIAASGDYRADKDRIKADFKAAKDKCKSMTGNAKAVCDKEAKGNEKVALAELEAKRKGTPHAEYEVEVAKAKAAYDVAQEKCDDMKGKEKSACKKEAKAQEQKALADAKAHRKDMASNTSPTTTSTTAPATTGTTTKETTKKY
jgi:hypothetical protein